MLSTDVLLECAMFAETFVALCTLVLMAQKKLLKRFCFVAIYLGLFVIENAITTSMLFFRKEIGMSKLMAYNTVFYTRWVSFFLLSGLILLIIHSVFSYAMKPLKGLSSAGKLIFRWIFAVSMVVSVCIAVSPHVGSGAYFTNIAGQLQQAISILTICLLLFVCFSIRHLGMDYRSYGFGISLGLGVMATVSLVETAWFTTNNAQSLYSPLYLYSALGACVALMVWTTYFAMPEPAPKMVLLPTTSPYFLWNSISEALGDDPGHVAIAGFKPSMLAPAEMAVLSRQGRARQQLRDQEAAEAAASAAQTNLQPASNHAESVRPAFAMQP